MTVLDPLQTSPKHKELAVLDLKIDPQRIIAAMAKDQVTIVLPTLNESGGISQVIEEIKEEGYHSIIVVDGYSTDMTDRIAFGNGVKLAYQHGIGKAGAVKTAIEHEKEPYLLFMDGDGTYDPKDIWRLLNHADHYSHVIEEECGETTSARDQGTQRLSIKSRDTTFMVQIRENRQ